MKKTFFAFTLFFGMAAAFAQTVTGLGFTPDVVRPGEQTTYTISISGASPKIDLTQIPIPEGLQFAGSGQSQNISMGTGMGVSRELKLNLYFVPTKEGEFEIKSWQISDAGKTYEIAAAKVKADPNAPQQIRPSRSDPWSSMRQRQQPRRQESINLNKETKLELMLGKEKVFIGQSVPCTLAFTMNGKIFKAGYTPRNMRQPQIKNGDAFNCAGFFSDPHVEQSQSDLTAVLQYDTFITPIKAGEHDIQFEIMGELMGEPDFQSNSIFSMMGAFGERHPFQTEMSPLKIKVEELPAPPPDFSNAIGSFKIESAVIDEAALSVGTPATLTVKVSGEGNFERMNAPLLGLDGNWKEYKPKQSFEDLSGGYGFKGVKTFEYTIVPTKADISSAPLATLTYFDPKAEKYETVSSKEIEVSVAPSKSSAKRASEANESDDPLGGLLKDNAGNAAPKFYTKPWFWIAQGTIAVFFVAIVAKKRRQNRLDNDHDYARVQLAKKELKSSLKQAKAASQNDNAKAFFESAAQSLQYAICAVSSLEAKAVTLSDAENILRKMQDGQKLCESAKIYFEGADAIAFGGYTPNAGELAGLYETLENICEKIS